MQGDGVARGWEGNRSQEEKRDGEGSSPCPRDGLLVQEKAHGEEEGEDEEEIIPDLGEALGRWSSVGVATNHKPASRDSTRTRRGQAFFSPQEP